MTAREFLSQAARLDETIKRLMDERMEVRAMATSLGAVSLSADKVQTSPRGEARYVKHLECLEQLEARLDAAITERLEYKLALVSAFEKMSDSTEVAVLHARYMDGLTWDEASLQLGFSARTLRRIHSRALLHFPVPERWRDLH